MLHYSVYDCLRSKQIEFRTILESRKMKRVHLSRDIQLRAIGMKQGGMNMQDVAETVNSTKSTISDIKKLIP